MYVYVLVMSLDLNTWLATPEGGARYGAGNIAYLASNPGVGCWAWYQTQCLDHVCYGFPLPDLNTWLVTPEGGARHGAGHIVHLAGNPGVGCWAWYPTSALITNCNAGYLL